MIGGFSCGVVRAQGSFGFAFFYSLLSSRSRPTREDRDRVAGKRALALGVRVRRARAVKANTGLRGLAPRTGFPLNCRTPPLLGANEHHTARPTPPLYTPLRRRLSRPPRLR